MSDLIILRLMAAARFGGHAVIPTSSRTSDDGRSERDWLDVVRKARGELTPAVQLGQRGLAAFRWRGDEAAR